MISFLRGVVADHSENSVILDVGGVGYEVYVPYRTLCRLENTEGEVALYTYLQVTEDHFALFGFPTKKDLSTFKLLIGVSGIGPKGALGIMSNMTTEELILAVVSEDSKTIAKAPGIGAKTAAKLVLELKDKFSLSDTLTLDAGHTVESLQSMGTGSAGVTAEYESMRNEAIQALTALGYTSSEALRAVRDVVPEADMTTEKLIKLGLKNIR